MKRTALLFLLCLFCCLAKAQKSDSTHTHYAFYRGFSSHETELKSKKGVKNGEYKIFNGKKVIVTGLYKDDQRVGRWRFYNQADSLDQVYNYTTKNVEYNRPNERLTFYLDSVKEGDKVIYPSKIGGFYGLFNLFSFYKPPYVVQKSIGEYNLYYVFTLDETGKLIKYETRIASENYNKIEEIDLKRLKPEDFDFTPAQVNGKKVGSTLVAASSIKVNIRQ